MEYLPGQLWEYKTRKGDEHTKILILKTECIDAQDIVHITIVGEGFDGPEHMPFIKQALDNSIVKLVDDFVSIPDYENGYMIWKNHYIQGEAGIYKITVSEVLSL